MDVTHVSLGFPEPFFMSTDRVLITYVFFLLFFRLFFLTLLSNLGFYTYVTFFPYIPFASNLINGVSSTPFARRISSMDSRSSLLLRTRNGRNTRLFKRISSTRCRRQ